MYHYIVDFFSNGYKLLQMSTSTVIQARPYTHVATTRGRCTVQPNNIIT